jgi:hypothetical protein
MPSSDSEYSQKPVGPDVSIGETTQSPEAEILDESANAIQAENVSSRAGKQVAKATAGIGVLHFLRLLIGVIAQPLIANRLGLSSHF